MAQQELQFNLNQVSAEGAGKMYEVLASNAGKNAEEAAMSKQLNLNESTTSLNLFQRYHDASQNTMARSVNTGNQAVAALNKGNEYLNQSAQRTMAYNNQMSNLMQKSMLQISNAASKMGNYIKAAEIDADNTEGAIAGLRDYKHTEAKLDTDPNAVVDEVEAMLTSLEADPKNAYLQAYIKPFLSIYGKAVEGAETDRRNTVLMKYMGYMQTMDNNVPDKDRATFAKVNNVHQGWLRDMEYTIVSKKFDKRRAEATTSAELAKINSEWLDISKERYDNVHLLKSSADQTQKVVAEAQQSTNEVNRAALKRFKDQGYSIYQNMIDDPLDEGNTPELRQTIYSDMGLNAEARAGKEAKFSTAYADATAAKQFSDTYSYNEPSPYWDTLNKKDLEEAELATGIQLFKLMEAGRIEEAGQMLEAHSGHLKQFGSLYMEAFNRGNPEQKQFLYEKASAIDKDTTTSRILSQTLSDGDLARILTTGELAGYFGNTGDVGKDRAWEQAAKFEIDSTKRGVELTYNTDKDLWNQVTKSRVFTDSQYKNRFYNMIQTMYKAGAPLGKDNFEKVENYFLGLEDNVEVLGEGMKLNSEHSADPLKVGIPETNLAEARDELTKRALFKFDKVYGFTPLLKGMTFLPDGMIRFTDDYSYSTFIMDSKPFIKDFNTAKEKQAQAEVAHLKKAREYVKENLIPEFALKLMPDWAIEAGYNFGSIGEE